MLQCWPVVRRTVEVLTKVVVYWRCPKLISIKNSKSYISWTCWLCLLTTLCAFRHNVHVKQNLVYNSYLSIPFATSRLWRDQALLSGPCFDGMALLAFLLSVVSIRVLRSKWAVHGPHHYGLRRQHSGDSEKYCIYVVYEYVLYSIKNNCM